MIDKGIIEIDGKRTGVARGDIRKLKFILDELCIMHIIDDVSFCSTPCAAEQMEDIHDVRMSKAENDGKVLPKTQFSHRDKLQFRELKIPYFCLIDFISLAQLDYEEAELLGDLVYCTQN